MRTPKVIDPPKTIYLVAGDLDEDAPFDELHEVSWCADKIGQSDVEYRLVKRSALIQEQTIANDVISIRPQLLCGTLSRELGRYIKTFPSASPAEMLEVCNQIFAEIGAVQIDGVWSLPSDGN